VGDDRGQPETGIWARAADPYPAQSGEYRPRRAKPGPPDPYLPRSEHPLRSGPYLRPGGGSASERFAVPRPDPLRDPIPAPDPAPDPAPPREQPGGPVPGSAFGWWNTNGNFASDRDPEGPRPDRRAPGRDGPPVDGQRPPRREPPPARPSTVWEQPPREQSAGRSAVHGQAGPSQGAPERAAREQSAPWHTGKRDTQDEPVQVRPGGAPAGGPWPDADPYPADFPTQVFMSSALAAWDQPAQAAPAGNWPRVAEPSPPPGQHGPAEPPGRYDSARPPGRSQPAAPSGSGQAPAQSPHAGPRHATAAAQPGGAPPRWDRDPGAGAEPHPPANARRARPRHHGAPFPPAQNPAELYQERPAPGRPAGPPPARSRPPAGRRGLPAGVLIGAACLAVLAAIALILFVALPG
jgi:putative peptidoglycan lipid II flippase